MSDNHDLAATPLLLQMLPAPFQDWTTPLLAIATILTYCKTRFVDWQGMTEKQGGSDVMSNTTSRRAPGRWLLSAGGHKWFFSVPQKRCALAGADYGRFVLLFVPRFLPDGQRNAIRLERLKDKLQIA